MQQLQESAVVHNVLVNTYSEISLISYEKVAESTHQQHSPKLCSVPASYCHCCNHGKTQVVGGRFNDERNTMIYVYALILPLLVDAGPFPL